MFNYYLGFTIKIMNTLERLRQLIHKLRDPHTGCVWNRIQNFQSIVPYTIEEAYEVSDVVENEAWCRLPEELGDLLYQVLYLCELGEEEERFTLDSVMDALELKILRRNPDLVDEYMSSGEKLDTSLGWSEIKSADRRQKGFRALAFFAVAVIAGGLGIAPLPICFLSAAALTVATRCITMQKVYEVIDWRVLIVIGGMTAFGSAMRESGTAEWLAGGIQSISENPRTVLAGFILLTMLLTQTMSNAAAALVVLPVAMQTAGTLDVSGQTFAIAVMLGASSSFIAPFEPACILVSGPGKYRFTDYLKAGLGLTLIMGFLVWLMVPLVWGF